MHSANHAVFFKSLSSFRFCWYSRNQILQNLGSVLTTWTLKLVGFGRILRTESPHCHSYRVSPVEDEISFLLIRPLHQNDLLKFIHRP